MNDKQNHLETDSGIVDDLGVVWRYYPETGRVTADGDDSEGGGYYCDGPGDARRVLEDGGYISNESGTLTGPARTLVNKNTDLGYWVQIL